MGGILGFVIGWLTYPLFFNSGEGDGTSVTKRMDGILGTSLTNLVKGPKKPRANIEKVVESEG